MNNHEIPFHIKSAILLVGICSCVFDENIEQFGKDLDELVIEIDELDLDELQLEIDELDELELSGPGDISGPEITERTGIEVASDPLQGDFNGDGYADLAIGVPGANLASTASGVVTVMYGTNSGLSAADIEIWQQGTGGLSGAPPRSGDQFGRALAVGDFDHDGYADLAIGAPFDRVNGDAGAGSVTVLYGSNTGLTGSGSQYWHQDRPGVKGGTERADNFGHAMTTGDFDHDGYDDLAIGVPRESVSNAAGAGAVNVIYGSMAGLTAMNDQMWSQSTAGSVAEVNDHFGWALAAGDFNHDGSDDLAIGVPDEDSDGGSIPDAGQVEVLYGSLFAGLTPVGAKTWHQDILAGDPREESDRFGAALAVGDFNGNRFEDLAIGIPGEDVGSNQAGAISAIYGSAKGLGAINSQFLHQDLLGVEDPAGQDDSFGESIAAGDFNNDGHADLAVGVPNNRIGGVNGAGLVQVLYGTSAEPALVGVNTIWHQNNIALDGTALVLRANTQDQFGKSLSMGDFDGDGTADLVIGIPFENVGSMVHAGEIYVMYGDHPAGLTAAGGTNFNQRWNEASPGMSSIAETADKFGFAVRTM